MRVVAIGNTPYEGTARCHTDRSLDSVFSAAFCQGLSHVLNVNVL